MMPETISENRRVPCLWLASLLLLLLALAIQPASAATLRWTGAHATSSDWSRGANWNSGTAPANGDILVFDPVGAARLANNNDLTGLQVAIIRFNGVNGGYTLSGNAVTVTGGVEANNTGSGNRIALARVTLGNAMSFTVAQPVVALTIESEVRLSGNDLTADATGFLILQGVISGTGNVTKIGAGLLTLSGAAGNTFTGNLFANAGTVFLGKSAGLAVTNRLIIGDGAGGSQADGVGMLANNQVNEVTINSSGLWSLGNFEDEVSDLVLNRGGDVTTGATGKLRLGSGAGITVNPAADATPNLSTLSGFLELAAGTHLITVGENTADAGDLNELEIDAVISGTGLGSGLTKEGAGDLQLSGDNTFTGQVIVNAGEVRVNHASALGATGNAASTTVNNDATLRVIDSVAVGNELLRMNSTGLTTGNLDAALRCLGTASWAGDIILMRDTRIAAAVDFTLRGTISGTGDIIKQNTGLLRIAGNAADNTFAGDLLVNAGTVELDKGTVGGLVAVPGRLIIGDGLGGAGADVARLRKDNQVSKVTVNGSGLWDLGVFQEEVADLDLIDGGDVTTAATGLLRLGIGTDVTVTPGTTAGTDVSTISGKLELMLGTHRFTVDNGNSARGDGYLVVNAVVSGAGGITKAGLDQLELSAANSFAAAVTIDAGQLVASHALALGLTIGGTRVNDTGMLSLFGSGTVSGESLTLDTSGLNPPDMPNALVIAGDWVWTGDVTLLRQTRMNLLSAASLNLSGAISGASGITKNGNGALTFSGNTLNTYSGPTFVDEGRLLLDKSIANGALSGALTVGDGTGGANADVVQCLRVNQFGGLAAVTVNSSGQFITRQESIGSLAGSGNVSVSGSLNPGANDASTTFSGVISGAGAFNKMGAGTLTFSGNNTYTSGTGIAAGTLLVNGQQPSSFVLVQPGATLGGTGRVGALSTFANGPIVSPGASPGRLTSGNVILGVNSIFRVELNGPTPGTTHDQLRVFGTVDIGGVNLDATLNFIPTLGQPLVLIDNDGTDAVVNQFNGLAEGDVLRVNQIPFIVSYVGGDGNDVTLTATNRTLSIFSTRVEAGNGNGVIDPNECDHLFIALMNETSLPLSVSHVVLDSLTPGVAVTDQRATYALFGPLDIRTNRTPFQIRTTPDFVCGQLIEFALTVTLTGGGGGTFTIPFTMPGGGAGAPVQFDNGANLNLPDLASATSTITVASAAPYVGKVAVSVHITHPSAGDLVLSLRSPSGATVRLASNIGGAIDNYGTGCGDANRTTFDDTAPVRIAAGTAPFVGSFTPEEPLSAFLGENPNGDWQLLINDTLAGDTGELRCWSLLVSPPSCTDGGGACDSCTPKFTGRFNPDMPSTLTRLFRNGVPSGCGSAKPCPAVTTGARLFYRVHLITNTGPETCVSAVLTDLCRASNLRLHAAAYLGSYNPANPCANYLGDTGSELTTNSASFSFAAPSNAVIALVVSSPTNTPTCPLSYQVQLHGLPCPPPTLHIAKTANPDEVRLYWSTAYPNFDLQRTPTLNGAAPYPFVNIPFTPFVVNGDYSVTNKTTAPQSYYRLRKP